MLSESLKQREINNRVVSGIQTQSSNQRRKSVNQHPKSSKNVLGCKIKKLLNKKWPRDRESERLGKFLEKNAKCEGLVSVIKKDISKQRVGDMRCNKCYLFETFIRKVKPSETMFNWAFR
jgi:hypothetical protein